MSVVQYFTACTLDGYIADDNDSLDWLYEVPHADADDTWDRFFPRVGALVMGATTYQRMLERYDMVNRPETWHEFYGDRPAWVFSHRPLPPIPGVALRVVAGAVADVHPEVLAAAGERNVWLVGGGDLVGQYDDAGLLDEIWLGMAPVTLGGGRPLLPRRITSARLRVREAGLVGQRVRVVLDVAPREP